MIFDCVDLNIQETISGIFRLYYEGDYYNFDFSLYDSLKGFERHNCVVLMVTLHDRNNLDNFIKEKHEEWEKEIGL